MKAFSLVGVLAVSYLASEVRAHGAMSFPRTRNTITTHTCPQCANGNGVCGAGGGSQWQADAAASSALNSAYTTPLTQLVSGGRVEIEAYFTATHQGHFVVEFCQNPGSTISDSCFVRLERDPGDTRFSPYLSEISQVALLPTNGCLQQFNSQGNPLRMRFKVPNGANTEHGILRWFWQTGNSCDSSSYNSGSGVPPSVSGWSNTLGSQTCKIATTNMGSCGTNCPTSSCRGEQFRNCADVKVVSGDPNTIVNSGNAHTDIPNGGGGGSGGGNGGDNGGGSGGNGGGNGGGSGGNGGGSGGNGGGNGGGSGGNGGGSDNGWAGSLNACKAGVVGVQPWWDDACRDYCAEAVGDPFYMAYCSARGISDLKQCVLNVRAAACKSA